MKDQLFDLILKDEYFEDEFDEVYEKIEEWIDSKPSQEEVHGFFTQLLSLENHPDFDTEARFGSLLNLIEESLSDWKERDNELHWQLSQMLYRMGQAIDTDLQTTIDILGNFAGWYPNHKVGMRMYLKEVYENDWYIKFFEDQIERIKDPEFAAECGIQYAHIKAGMAAWGSGLTEDYQAEIFKLLKQAKTNWPALTWKETAEWFEEQELTPKFKEKVAQFKGQFM